MVRKLSSINDDGTVVIDDTGDIYVIRPTAAIRRVCAIHICTHNCTVRTEGLKVVVLHDNDAKTYHIAAAKTGFPPHMG